MTTINVTSETQTIQINSATQAVSVVGSGPTGPAGPTGADGADGADGQGVPTGGTTGQVLAKASGTDYDTEWVAQSGGGSSDHGTLTGLGDDDHTQYALADGTRGTFEVAGAAATAQSAAEATAAAALSSHASDTTAIHGIADTSALLDTGDIGVTVQGYSAVLAATTASFTTADETKLDGIETGATADQSAAEILTAIKTVDGASSGLDADLLDGNEAAAFATAAQGALADSALQSDDIGVTVQGYSAVLAATTASFTTADETKLDGIETGADVTDAANVSAAGAPMITSGAGAPGSTPSKVGDIYIDTTGDDAYIAVGTASSADWEKSNDGSGAGSTDLAWNAGTSTISSSSGDDATLTVVDATNPGLMTVAQKSKLDGIEALADVTDATNVAAAGAHMAGGTDVPVADGGTGASTAADARTNLGVAIGSDVQAYSAVLAATTASFTTADETKLDGIETAATADQTGAEIKALYEAEADTNAFDDAAVSKLAGIEALADVTDATNVAAAGAHMAGGTDVPVADGGTGASTAAGARTNLGLVIGTDVQAQDTELQAIAGLTSAADKVPYFTGSGTAALADLTSAGRALIDDASASAQRTTLGLGSLATASTINDSNWSGTDLAVANGGTGASDAATARTNLGLGSIATQASSSVTITGGSITGITDLAVADGGTGASTAAAARTNLGVAAAPQAYYWTPILRATDTTDPNTGTGGSAGKIGILNVTPLASGLYRVHASIAIVWGTTGIVNPTTGTYFIEGPPGIDALFPHEGINASSDGIGTVMFIDASAAGGRAHYKGACALDSDLATLPRVTSDVNHVYVPLIGAPFGNAVSEYITWLTPYNSSTATEWPFDSSTGAQTHEAGDQWRIDLHYLCDDTADFSGLSVYTG